MPPIPPFTDGYEVTFIEDAVGDTSKQQHDTAVLRLAHAGAIPNTTVGMIAEWFLDWKLPVANEWRRVAVPYYDEIAALQRAPEFQTPHGFTVAKNGCKSLIRLWYRVRQGSSGQAPAAHGTTPDFAAVTMKKDNNSPRPVGRPVEEGPIHIATGEPDRRIC